MELLKEDQRYTYHDYVQWDDDQRWELIDGVPYMMAAPRVNHQRIVQRIGFWFHQALKGKPCEPFFAPVDVRLNFDKADDTVVQPDVFVVCDPTKITEKTVDGIPDLVVEVLSPSTSRNDRWFKYNAYQSAGVREYWIVDPDNRTVEVYLLIEGLYHKDNVYDTKGIIKPNMLAIPEMPVIDMFED